MSIKDFGCFVEVRPGKQGLLHLSQLAMEYIQSPWDLFEEGDTVDVKVMEIKNNRISLSRCALCTSPSSRCSPDTGRLYSHDMWSSVDKLDLLLLCTAYPCMIAVLSSQSVHAISGLLFW